MVESLSYIASIIETSYSGRRYWSLFFYCHVGFYALLFIFYF